MSARIVCFLQNAWSPLYAGGTWPRQSWLRALARSRSGTRLSIMLDDLSCCENTTPIVGPTASSVVAPDDAYIARILKARKPDAVVACGKQAEAALRKSWKGPLLVVPHPAHRLLTDELYHEARRILSGPCNWTGIIKLNQERGGISSEQEIAA